MDSEDNGLIQDRIIKRFGKYMNEFKSVAITIQVVIENEEWREVHINGLSSRKYESFVDFVEADMPFGLATDIDVLMQLCKNNSDTVRLLEIEKKGETAVRNSNHAMGLTNDYKLQRLQRERPDLAQQVIMLEMSANAAYIEAGFAKKKVTVTLTPEGFTKYILNHFSEEEVNQIKLAL